MDYLAKTLLSNTDNSFVEILSFAKAIKIYLFAIKAW